jgi:hypothetical protein
MNNIQQPPTQKKSRSCADESKPLAKREFNTAPPIERKYFLNNDASQYDKTYRLKQIRRNLSFA